MFAVSGSFSAPIGRKSIQSPFLKLTQNILKQYVCFHGYSLGKSIAKILHLSENACHTASMTAVLTMVDLLWSRGEEEGQDGQEERTSRIKRNTGSKAWPN